MKPIYIPNYIDNTEKLFFELNKLIWENQTETRQEYFMALRDTEYTYGSGNGIDSSKWSGPYSEVTPDIDAEPPSYWLGQNEII